MTTRVKFCLLYDPLKMIFYRLQNEHYFNKNRIVDTTLSVTLRVRSKMLLHLWSYDFYDTMLSMVMTRCYPWNNRTSNDKNK